MKPEINLNGWQTVQAYAECKGVQPQNVYNWLKRKSEKVELESIRVKELNNILLVKEKK